MSDDSVDTQNMIFVFGSNLSGRHGAGAARYAWRHKGARLGVAYGLQGQSFALPTMNRHIQPLNLTAIKLWIEHFLRFAEDNPDLEFQVTCVGCGLGGQKSEDIAPMFADAPDNCWFDTAWKGWLPDKKFWGTF